MCFANYFMCGSKMFLLVVIFFFFLPPELMSSVKPISCLGLGMATEAWKGGLHLGKRSLLSVSLCVLKGHERFVNMTILI